jgi:uncharacterized protein YegL
MYAHIIWSDDGCDMIQCIRVIAVSVLFVGKIEQHALRSKFHSQTDESFKCNKTQGQVVRQFFVWIVESIRVSSHNALQTAP